MKYARNLAIAAAGAIALTSTAVGAAHAADVSPTTGVVVGTGSDGLNVRTAALAESRRVDNYPEGVRMNIDCSAEGGAVLGETTWYRLVYFDGQDRWVSAKFVDIQGNEPQACR